MTETLADTPLPAPGGRLIDAPVKPVRIAAWRLSPVSTMRGSMMLIYWVACLPKGYTIANWRLLRHLPHLPHLQ